MTLKKAFWAIRGICCKASFGRFGNISYIGRPTSIIGRKGIFVGDRVRIQPGIRMETADNGSMIIGENTTILGNSFITNIDHGYEEIGVHIMEQERRVSTTKIGKNCFIGFGACIQAGTVLGEQCVVGANAVVRGTFPDRCVIAGVPARIVKQYDPDTKKWEKVKHD